MVAHISLSPLRRMPGAADLEDAWIRTRLGEDGCLHSHAPPAQNAA